MLHLVVCWLEGRTRMPHDHELVGSHPAVANIMGIVILIGSASVCQGNELNKLGMNSTIESALALHPAAPGSILGIPKSFSLDVAEIY